MQAVQDSDCLDSKGAQSVMRRSDFNWTYCPTASWCDSIALKVRAAGREQTAASDQTTGKASSNLLVNKHGVCFASSRTRAPALLWCLPW